MYINNELINNKKNHSFLYNILLLKKKSWNFHPFLVGSGSALHFNMDPDPQNRINIKMIRIHCTSVFTSNSFWQTGQDRNSDHWGAWTGIFNKHKIDFYNSKRPSPGYQDFNILEVCINLIHFSREEIFLSTSEKKMNSINI